MKKTRIIVIIIASFLAALFLGLILFSGSPKNSTQDKNHQKINIVTTTDIYAEAAGKVVGNKGTVKSVIDNPHVDPHDFKPTTQTTRFVSNADLVVSNGLGYDDWVNPIVNKQPWINVGRDIAHKKSGANPHLWFDYEIMEKYTKYLTAKLSDLQPENKKYFSTNAKKYLKSMEPIYKKSAVIKSLKSNSFVDVSEPIFDYALNNLGFTINNPAFSKAIENETDPAIKDAQTVVDDFRNHRVAFYLHNIQAENNTTKSILKDAKKYQIPILYLTENKPKNLTYIKWQLDIYDKLEKLLMNNKN
ncbi:metal ABC transporter solute-binding protein, Zn/Mn family [Xylocopilactobacillus apis]|nr:zinc ABC transporter substrate-binding protein [Xylocopilactobacillus apis]